MPRGKIQMSLIGDAGDRAKAFARRKKGLAKKAKELAKLCGVDVALVVCAAGPDGGAPFQWESDPGVVIDRYRRLPADKRAMHTHHEYINGQLGKEERRLDKKRRQGLKALACPGEAVLEGMDLEELLASIDKALLATAERQKALAGAGVADDDGQQLGQQVSSDAAVPVVVGQGDGPPFVGGSDLDDIQAWVDELMWDGADPLPLNNAGMMQPASGVIQYNNGNDGVDMVSNHQCQAQTPPGNGENGHGGQQFPWHAYQPNTAVSQPDYHGFQCAGNNYYVDMDEYSELLVPSNANAYDGCYDQACWCADESSVAVLPAAAAAYPSLDIPGNPAYMPPQHEHPSMTIGSFTHAGGLEYETGCLADYLQCPDASQHFGDEPEPLYYLSDMAQGISYYNDLEAGGCNSGRAQLFAQIHSCSGTPQFSGSEQSQLSSGRSQLFNQSHSCFGTPQFRGSEQFQSDVGHQYQDPGAGEQHFWAMEGPPGSTDVATARGGGTWANSGGLYQPWISVYQ